MRKMMFCPRDGWDPNQEDQALFNWPAMIDVNIHRSRIGIRYQYVIITRWLCPICFDEFICKQKFMI